MRAKSTLWAEPDALESLLPRLAGPFSHHISSLVDPLLDLLFVLQLSQLRTNRTNNDVLVLGQILQGFEPAGPFSVVFQVEGVNVEVLE